MPINEIEELTWNKLFRINYAMSIPFKLNLGEHDFPVFCDEIVRVIPGKRLVAFGTWNDQAVVLKLFYERGKAKRHIKRELEGVETLLGSGVPTPKILFQGETLKKRVHVLMFERIIDAVNLDDIWQAKTTPQELAPLMHAVTIELATQHVLGVMQKDLHLKNYLLKGNQILTLDSGSIEFFHEPLAKKLSLEHLGLFFAQLGVGTEELQHELFQVYAKARGWLVKKSDISYLQAAIKKSNDERWRDYQNKINRNCTAFAKIAKAKASIMYDRSFRTPDFLNFLANPEIAFTHQNAEILKAGRSSTLAKITINNKVLVVKRYNIKNIAHGLRRCLRPTRAAKSWQIGQLLRLFGVATPKPIAFIENRVFGLRGRSYFVMEYVEGENLGDYFAKYQPDDAHFAKIAVRVVTLLKNLTKLRISHGDLKMTNILIADDRPMLLDLDGVTLHRSPGETKRAYKQEIKRFMKNWAGNAGVRELFETLLQG